MTADITDDRAMGGKPPSHSINSPTLLALAEEVTE